MAAYLEVGAKRVFAAALDWPGWCRSGKTEEAALEALGVYAVRYRPVAKLANAEVPKELELEVIERVKGNATTDFGAPDGILEADRTGWTAAEQERHLALLRAAWKYFDKTVDSAPSALRKGPRGGGRDRDTIVEHVVGAESGYGRMLGVKLQQPAVGDAHGIDAMREELVDALRVPKRTDEKAWPPRYALRRIAWHALDHAWEIEDRSEGKSSTMLTPNKTART